ncbi:MAG: hypothetical protein DIU72_003340 [Pseudomonadota bacterium]|nr:MAG: hypothetical protein DIU72_06590 [Pseudomonadota bacterium]
MEVQAAQGPEVAIRLILVLVALSGLAYLGGLPAVQRLERRLRIAQLVTAGFPFLAIGIVLGLPSVGILTESVLSTLSPLLGFGLGWIGFSAGFRLDVRELDDLPKGTARAVGFATALPFAFVVASVGLFLLVASDWSRLDLSNPAFLRGALVLGTAGAMTAPQAARLLGESGREQRMLLRLEELAGMVGMAFIAAYFRPRGDGIGWHLPDTAWLFLTVGLGGVLGVVAYVVLQRASAPAESVLLLLGTVAFGAGFGSRLYLAPMVVCFVAGVFLSNVPGEHRARLREALGRLERPIYLLFLVAVGAMWKFADWRGWALLPFFVTARLGGKWLAEKLIRRTTELAADADHWMARRAPIGQLSIAIVVSAQLLFPEGEIPILETAVIGGAVVTELFAQVFARNRAKTRPTLALGVEP